MSKVIHFPKEPDALTAIKVWDEMSFTIRQNIIGYIINYVIINAIALFSTLVYKELGYFIWVVYILCAMISTCLLWKLARMVAVKRRLERGQFIYEMVDLRNVVVDHGYELVSCDMYDSVGDRYIEKVEDSPFILSGRVGLLLECQHPVFRNYLCLVNEFILH